MVKSNMTLLTTCPEHYCDDSGVCTSIKGGAWVSDISLPLLCINPSDIMHSLMHGRDLSYGDRDLLFTEDIQMYTSKTLYHAISTLLGLPSCGVESISPQDLLLRLVALGEQITREVCGEAVPIPHAVLVYQLRDALLAQCEEALKSRIDNLQYVLQVTSCPPDSVMGVENRDWILKMTQEKANLPSRIKRAMVVNRHLLVFLQNCRRWIAQGLSSGSADALSAAKNVRAASAWGVSFMWEALVNAIRSGSVMCVGLILDYIRESTSMMVSPGPSREGCTTLHCALGLLPEEVWRVACVEGRHPVMHELIRQVQLVAGLAPLACAAPGYDKPHGQRGSNRWSFLHCLLTGMESHHEAMTSLPITSDGSPWQGSEGSVGCYMFGRKSEGTYGKSGRERESIFLMFEKLQCIDYFMEPLRHQTIHQDQDSWHHPGLVISSIDVTPLYPFSVVDILAMRGMWASVESILKSNAIPFQAIAGPHSLRSDSEVRSVCCTSALIHCAVLEGRPNILGTLDINDLVTLVLMMTVVLLDAYM
jgi:hypothetical protein